MKSSKEVTLKKVNVPTKSRIDKQCKSDASLILNPMALRDQVYEYLREEIIAGRIEGERVNLNVLSETLAVSKTPLRDALIRLSAEGFVTILPRHGIIIKSLTREEARNFFQIIAVFEGEVLREVFGNLDPIKIDKMILITAAMRRVIGFDSFSFYYNLDLSFHNIFLDLTPNDRLRTLVSLMKQQLFSFLRNDYQEAREFLNCDEHDEIVDCLRKRNVGGAVKILKDAHWCFGNKSFHPSTRRQ